MSCGADFIGVVMNLTIIDFLPMCLGPLGRLVPEVLELAKRQAQARSSAWQTQRCKEWMRVRNGSKVLSIFMSSVTSPSPQSGGFLDKFDMLCVAEHHIKQLLEATVFQVLQKSGGKLVIALARLTAEIRWPKGPSVCRRPWREAEHKGFVSVWEVLQARR